MKKLVEVRQRTIHSDPLATLGMRKDKMKYSIKKDLNIHAIVVEATGMINTVAAKEMVMSAGIALNATGIKRCFFDLSNTEVDPEQTMIAMLVFSQVFERAGISKSVRMAALYTSGEDHRLYLEECTTFLDMQLKHFKDRSEALAWLCHPQIETNVKTPNHH